MAEYIERGALVKRLEITPILKYGVPTQVRDGVLDLVKNQPGADVALVVHGQWEMRDSSKTKVWCSVCGHRRDIYTQIGWKYCPNCGAKMDGEGQ